MPPTDPLGLKQLLDDCHDALSFWGVLIAKERFKDKVVITRTTTHFRLHVVGFKATHETVRDVELDGGAGEFAKPRCTELTFSDVDSKFRIVR
jgi:hypothetical protein